MAICNAFKKIGFISHFHIRPEVQIYTGNLVPRIKIIKTCGITLNNIGNVFDTENLYETKWHRQIIQAFLIECGFYEPEAVDHVLKVFNTLDYSIKEASEEE